MKKTISFLVATVAMTGLSIAAQAGQVIPTPFAVPEIDAAGAAIALALVAGVVSIGRELKKK